MGLWYIKSCPPRMACVIVLVAMSLIYHVAHALLGVELAKIQHTTHGSRSDVTY